MKAFIVVVFLAFLALSATTQEKESSEEVTEQTANKGDLPNEGYKLSQTSEFLKPRPARWQTRMNTRGWMGGSPNGMHPSMAESDPDYYPKLFNWLDKVGRR